MPIERITSTGTGWGADDRGLDSALALVSGLVGLAAQGEGPGQPDLLGGGEHRDCSGEPLPPVGGP